MVGCWAKTEKHNNIISTEHVISNVLGGRLTSKRLLCKGCNEYFGSTIDKELDGQLAPFASLLGVKTDKDSDHLYAVVAEDGTERMVGKNLKPASKITLLNKKTIFKKDDDVQPFVNATIKGYKQKKNLDVAFVESSELPDGKRYHIRNSRSTVIGDIEFGGYDFMRAIAKIAMNFAILNKVPSEILESIRAFILGEVNNNGLVDYYYPTTYEIYQLEDQEVNHVIYLNGDTQYRILYAYVELFSTENLIVILNSEYDGPPVDICYMYDLISSKRIEKNVSIKLTRQHFLDLRFIQVREIHQQRLNRLEKIIEKLQ